MPITLDGAVTTNEQTGTTSKTVASNADRLFLVSIGTHQSANASGVTFNGDAMTLLIRQEGDYGEHCEIWGLLAPDIGTYNVVVSGANNYWAQGIYSVYDCDQTELPTVVAGDNSGNNYAYAELTTPVDNCVIFGVMSSEPVPTLDTDAGDYPDVVGDFSQQGASYQNVRGAHIPVPTAGLQGIGWSLNYGSRWQVALVCVKPAVGSTFTPKIVMI